MAEANQEHRLQSFRDAQVGVDRLQELDLTTVEEGAVEVVGHRLQDEIEALEAEVEEH